MHPGDKGERHRLGHQRQRHGQPGQQFDPHPPGAEAVVGHPAQIGNGKAIGDRGHEGSGHEGS
jgi:hypothetical protein